MGGVSGARYGFSWWTWLLLGGGCFRWRSARLSSLISEPACHSSAPALSVFYPTLLYFSPLFSLLFFLQIMLSLSVFPLFAFYSYSMFSALFCTFLSLMFQIMISLSVFPFFFSLSCSLHWCFSGILLLFFPMCAFSLSLLQTSPLLQLILWLLSGSVFFLGLEMEQR